MGNWFRCRGFWWLLLAIFCILVFYQLIAPLPILFRMHEKTAKIFSSWLKITATCYFEVYIRIFIISYIKRKES